MGCFPIKATKSKPKENSKHPLLLTDPKYPNCLLFNWISVCFIFLSHCNTTLSFTLPIMAIMTSLCTKCLCIFESHPCFLLLWFISSSLQIVKPSISKSFTLELLDVSPH